jgi:hypothetical protein
MVLIVTVTGLGSVIVAVIELRQPLSSVTFAVYTPAVNCVPVVVFPPNGSQEVVYGAVPAVILIVAAPLLPPEQESLTTDTNESAGPGILTKEVVKVLIQPKESNVCKVYEPGDNPLILEVVTDPGLQE